MPQEGSIQRMHRAALRVVRRLHVEPALRVGEILRRAWIDCGNAVRYQDENEPEAHKGRQAKSLPYQWIPPPGAVSRTNRFHTTSPPYQ